VPERKITSSSQTSIPDMLAGCSLEIYMSLEAETQPPHSWLLPQLIFKIRLKKYITQMSKHGAGGGGQ